MPNWPPPPGRGSGIATAEKAADLADLGKSVIAEPLDGQGNTPSAMGPAGLVLWIGQQADGFSPWGAAPKMRDRQLRAFIPQENLLNSALYTVSARNAALSWKITGDEAPAEAAQEMLNNANAGAGFEDFVMRLSIDYYSCDSGAFVEFVRERPSETAAVIGLNNLDSIRCYPTGDPEYPVIYEDTHGKFHRMPWYTVAQLVEMPTAMSPQNFGAYYRMGYSAVTRALRAAQIMRSLSTYNDEKIGGRFMRTVHLISGVDDRMVQDSITRAQVNADAAGLTHYIQPMMISGIDPRAAVGHEAIDLASLPDGFDQKEMVEQYILALSMALGTDYQEFAPLPGGGLGTATQSETLHAKARGRGPGLFQKAMVRLFNQLGALPKGIQFEYDEPDLDADQQHAQIALLRAQRRTQDVTSGVLDATAAREIMLEDDDISQEIFDELIKRADEQAKADEAAQQAQQAAQIEAMQNPPDAGGDNNSSSSGNSAGNAQPAGRTTSATSSSSASGQATHGNENVQGQRDLDIADLDADYKALTTHELTQERIDYEAEMRVSIERGLTKARGILASAARGTKDNPNHDERGRFASASGGASDFPKADSPVATAHPPGTPEWTREVANDIKVGRDPTIRTSDLPALLTGMAALGMDEHPDITELNLDGTRLMGGEGLGIARIDMPQIPPEQRDQFLSDLGREGVRAVRERVDPTILKPAQKDVSGSRAGAIYNTFAAEHSGIPDANRILISQDNYVIDGHHTWAAAVGLRYAGIADTMPVYRLDTNIQDALAKSNEWAKQHGYEGQAIDAKKSYDDFAFGYIEEYERVSTALIAGERGNDNHDERGRFASGDGGGAADKPITINLGKPVEIDSRTGTRIGDSAGLLADTEATDMSMFIAGQYQVRSGAGVVMLEHVEDAWLPKGLQGREVMKIASLNTADTSKPRDTLAVLRKVTEAADKNGVTLTLDVQPYRTSFVPDKVDERALTRLYERYGFVEPPEDSALFSGYGSMVREPQVGGRKDVDFDLMENFSEMVRSLADVRIAFRENDNHDNLGRFASAPGGSAAVADKIAKQGGITVDVHTGSEPHTGIAVGAYPDREQSVDMKDWEQQGAKAIEDFIAKNADLLLQGDVNQQIAEVGGVPHLGAWVHEGRVIFDVTAVVPDHDKGVALGRQLRQVAVYDLASGEEIATGGAGGAALAGNKAVPEGAILVAMVPLAEMKSSAAARSAFFKAVSTAVAKAVAQE